MSSGAKSHFRLIPLAVVAMLLLGMINLQTATAAPSIDENNSGDDPILTSEPLSLTKCERTCKGGAKGKEFTYECTSEPWNAPHVQCTLPLGEMTNEFCKEWCNSCHREVLYERVKPDRKYMRHQSHWNGKRCDCYFKIY
eukprot:Nk52_evm14s289 gene=Nk52_evmTU14s289